MKFNNQEFVVVGLFAGAGGLDTGLMQAPFTLAFLPLSDGFKFKGEYFAYNKTNFYKTGIMFDIFKKRWIVMKDILSEIEAYIEKRKGELQELYNLTNESSYFYREDELDDLESFIKDLIKDLKS